MSRRASGLAADATFDLKLAATEALTNAVKGAPEDHVVDVAIEGGDGAVDVEVTNSGALSAGVRDRERA